MKWNVNIKGKKKEKGDITVSTVSCNFLKPKSLYLKTGL